MNNQEAGEERERRITPLPRDSLDHLRVYLKATTLFAQTVADFSQRLSEVHQGYASTIERLIDEFRERNLELRREKLDSNSSTMSAWEYLLQELEIDAQSHRKLASHLAMNVGQSLSMTANLKNELFGQLFNQRKDFDKMHDLYEDELAVAHKRYHEAYLFLKESRRPTTSNLSRYYKAHNAYLLQLSAADAFESHFYRVAIPSLLEEVEDVQIDVCNTLKEGIISISTTFTDMAQQQQKRFGSVIQLAQSVQVERDIFHVISQIQAANQPSLKKHPFYPVANPDDEEALLGSQIVREHLAETALFQKYEQLRRKESQFDTILGRNDDLLKALYTGWEKTVTGRDYGKMRQLEKEMSVRRQESRAADLELATVAAQINMISSRATSSNASNASHSAAAANGATNHNNPDEDDEEPSEKESASNPKQSRTTVVSMWRKAFRSLRSKQPTNEGEPSKTKSKKVKRKDSFKDEDARSTASSQVAAAAAAESGEVDPVYEMLKTASESRKQLQRKEGLNLPRQTSLGSQGSHSSDHTSPRSSRHGSHSEVDVLGVAGRPSRSPSSVSTSPRTRHRVRLTARMKSISLDNPEYEPTRDSPVNLQTKKKSLSSSLACFGGPPSPDAPSKANKPTYLEVRLPKARGSHIGTSQPAETFPNNLFVAIHNYKAKQPDDIELRAGTRLFVTDTSDPKWWKGKSDGRIGFFPPECVAKLNSPNELPMIVLNSLEIREGNSGILLHKDQIVIAQRTDSHGMIVIKTGDNQVAVPPRYLHPI